MIVCKISDAHRYAPCGSGIALAIEWLQNHWRDEFVNGVYSIGHVCPGGSEITVKCEEPALLPREKTALEAHRKFIDIHVPLKGPETIGWAPTDGLKHVREPYSEEADIAFFGDSAQCLVHLKVGQIAIFFPEDAHAPNIGLGNHRKLCIKIPVEN